MRRLLARLGLGGRRTAAGEAVIVVSGLPRSGTSMMMRMLEVGGVEVLSDGIRRPDPDNPRGYYEYERVKALPKGDRAWLGRARGKAVKVISELLRWLPPEHGYRIVFMRRELDEVLASQREMLRNRGEDRGGEDGRMADLYRRHLERLERWLAEQPNLRVLYVDYNRVLADPEPEIARLDEFLGGGLNVIAMAGVVEPALYRKRRA